MTYAEVVADAKKFGIRFVGRKTADIVADIENARSSINQDALNAIAAKRRRAAFYAASKPRKAARLTAKADRIARRHRISA